MLNPKTKILHRGRDRPEDWGYEYVGVCHFVSGREGRILTEVLLAEGQVR